MNSQNSKPAAAPGNNKACDACRTHKVRCLPNLSENSRICQRCTRTDRVCVYTATQRRKQRKRTDTRVAELEREVQAMRALFDRKSTSAEATPNSSSVTGTDNSYPNDSTTKTSIVPSIEAIDETTPSWEEDLTPSYSQPWTPPSFSPTTDVIDRGIISMSDATKLFSTYNDMLLIHYPAIHFHPSTTAQQLRDEKPTLFLSIIAAAAAMTDSHLYSVLNSEVLSAYAYRAVVRGEKNLELVQAMIVTSVWYFPPGKYALLKFYEYIHMATTMALDLGLGRNPRTSRGFLGDGDEKIDEEVELEKKRTFLVCYLISTGVSMSMRRPNMLRWSNWITECLQNLEDHPQSTKWDHLLAAWVKIVRITEECGTAFSFDDPSNMPSISELQNQFTMTGLQKSAEAWKYSLSPEIADNDALKLQYHHTQLYIHELAIHTDHPPEDFLPPYSLSKVLSIHPLPTTTTTTPPISSLTHLITSSHSLLSTLLSISLPSLRALPIYNFVRMSYALIILIKLYISSKCPSSTFGAVLDSDSLQLGTYLRSMIDKLIAAVGPGECRAPFTFLGMVMRMHGWYKSQEKEEVFKELDLKGGIDECWLPPVPRVLMDRKSGRPVAGGSEKMPGLEEYRSLETDVPQDVGGDRNEDGGEEVQVGDDDMFGFDAAAVSSFQYENLGDVDHFLAAGVQFDNWMFADQQHMGPVGGSGVGAGNDFVNVYNWMPIDGQLSDLT